MPPSLPCRSGRWACCSERTGSCGWSPTAWRRALFGRVGGRGPMIAASIGSVVTTATYGLVPTFPVAAAGPASAGAPAFRRFDSARSRRRWRPRSRARAAGSSGCTSRSRGSGRSPRCWSAGCSSRRSAITPTFVILGLATIPVDRAGAAAAVPSAYLPKPHGDAAPGRRSHGRLVRHGGACRHWLGWRERWLGGPRLVAVKIGMLANGFTSQGVVLATLTLALDRRRRLGRGRRGASAGCWWRFAGAPISSWRRGSGTSRIGSGAGRMIPALLVVEARRRGRPVAGGGPCGGDRGDAGRLPGLDGAHGLQRRGSRRPGAARSAAPR